MNKLRKEIAGYFLLQDFFEEYTTTCVVYEEQQKKFGRAAKSISRA